VNVTLMWRKVNDRTWSAAIERGKSNVVVGQTADGWKACMYERGPDRKLTLTDCGTFPTRKEALDAASQTVLGVRGHGD
jgi:hypothetical protein